MRKVWKWLSGKKRTIAEIYWCVAIPALAVVYPDGAPVDAQKVVAVVGLVMSYLGLGHAAVKQLGKDQ